MGGLIHWIVRWAWEISGARNESGAWYGAWSGFGGSIPDFILLGGLITFYRHHTCAHRPCRRWAHHVTKDGYKLCKIHIGKPLAELELHVIHEDHR
jgi:hypothetical protein